MKYTVKDLLKYINENNIPLDTPIGIHIGKGSILRFISESNNQIDDNIPITDKYGDIVTATYNGENNPILFLGLI